jgi:hypothetical protein
MPARKPSRASGGKKKAGRKARPNHTAQLRKGARDRKKLASARRKRNGAAVARRRNSEVDSATAAAELYEQFHGKPSTKYTTYQEPNERPTDLADLGKLIELIVWIDEDDAKELGPFKGVRVTATGEGGSIYFIGGDQKLDLEALDRADGMPKDHILIGPVEYIAYHTSKDFHDFEPTTYEHQFGEETGEQPWLCYDVRNRRMYLIGGAYRVRRPGIEN